jgi:hypothetical protein
VVDARKMQESVRSMTGANKLELQQHSSKEEIRILHLSDTHNNHWHIEKKFPFPEADILIHTGDFSNNGSREECIRLFFFFFFLIWL